MSICQCANWLRYYVGRHIVAFIYWHIDALANYLNI